MVIFDHCERHYRHHHHHHHHHHHATRSSGGGGGKWRGTNVEQRTKTRNKSEHHHQSSGLMPWLINHPNQQSPPNPLAQLTGWDRPPGARPNSFTHVSSDIQQHRPAHTMEKPAHKMGLTSSHTCRTYQLTHRDRSVPTFTEQISSHIYFEEYTHMYFYPHFYFPAQLVGRVYPQRYLGQAVVTGVVPSSPPGARLHFYRA